MFLELLEDKNIAAGQNADISVKGIDWGEEAGGDAEQDEGVNPKKFIPLKSWMMSLI